MRYTNAERERITAEILSLALPNCEHCGEGPDDEMAEVYDPRDRNGKAMIVHASCVPDGWEIG